jgi:hypothetical protein
MGAKTGQRSIGCEKGTLLVFSSHHLGEASSAAGGCTCGPSQQEVVYHPRIDRAGLQVKLAQGSNFLRDSIGTSLFCRKHPQARGTVSLPQVPPLATMRVAGVVLRSGPRTIASSAPPGNHRPVRH